MAHPRLLAALALILLYPPGVAADRAYVVNATSRTLSVIDLDQQTATHVPFDIEDANDVVVDPLSGRVYVSASNQLVHFDSSGGDMRTLPLPFLKASGMALDEAGGRLFVGHKERSVDALGRISVVDISDPANPRLAFDVSSDHAIDIRFLAWDPALEQLWAVADDGLMVITDPGDASLGLEEYYLSYAGRPWNPGGMAADPAGGRVAVTGRGNANPNAAQWVNLNRLAFFNSNGSSEQVSMVNLTTPRGVAYDAEGTVFLAVEDHDEVWRYDGGISFTPVLQTDENPYDVALFGDQQLVAVARRQDPGQPNGSLTTEGVASPVATEEKSIAVAVGRLLALRVSPGTRSFCYTALEQPRFTKFLVKNTGEKRITLKSPPRLTGLNPANYRIEKDTCGYRPLYPDEECSFLVRFSAFGPSLEPSGGSFERVTKGGRYPATIDIPNDTTQLSARLRAIHHKVCPEGN